MTQPSLSLLTQVHKFMAKTSWIIANTFISWLKETFWNITNQLLGCCVVYTLVLSVIIKLSELLWFCLHTGVYTDNNL